MITDPFSPGMLIAWLARFESNWIETITGEQYYFVDPELNQDLTLDSLQRMIAAALSNECRYSGQIDHHYSVASHTMLMLDYVKREYPSYAENTNVILGILLHDGPEGVLKDLASPLKEVLAPIYKELENRNETYFHQRFGVVLSFEEAELIKKADKEVLLAEAMVLMPSKGFNWAFREEFNTGNIAGLRIEPDKQYRPDEVRDEFLSILKHYSPAN